MPTPPLHVRALLTLVPVALALAACGADASYGQAGQGGTAVASTPEALRAHIASLHALQREGKGADAGKALLAMVPDEARLRRALAESAPATTVQAILTMYEGFRGVPPPPLAKDHHTEVHVHSATTAELAADAPGGAAIAEFPGGARQAAKAGLLRDGVTFHEVELLEPGQENGIKYHLFFHDGTGWSMLGAIWRAL